MLIYATDRGFVTKEGPRGFPDKVYTQADVDQMVAAGQAIDVMVFDRPGGNGRKISWWQFKAKRHPGPKGLPSRPQRSRAQDKPEPRRLIPDDAYESGAHVEAKRDKLIPDEAYT